MNPTEEQIEKALIAAEYIPNDANRKWMRAALSAALSSMPEQPQVQIVRWDDADMSELIIRDGPNFVGQPVNVYPVFDMESKELIGFRWYGEMGSSSMPEQEGWRMIDAEADQTEAPWDGRPVLICTNHNWGGDDNRVHRARWTDVIHGGGIFGWAVDDCKHGPYPLRGYTVITAWRPLPPPPLPAQEDDRG